MGANEANVEPDLQTRLMSEVNTMRARMAVVEREGKEVWDECESVVVKEVEPLIGRLVGEIDAMIGNNEHWKIISGVRESLQMAKEYKKKLIELRTTVRPMIVQGHEVKRDEIQQQQMGAS